MSEPHRHRVTEVEDLGEGDHEIVTVDGREVGLLHCDGEYFAFLNYCPHQGGPVCTGKVTRKLEGRFVGSGKRIERTLSDQRIITCPLHGWSFDLETGANIADENIVLPKYDVVVEDGVIYVEY